jgi:hypothetical protein
MVYWIHKMQGLPPLCHEEAFNLLFNELLKMEQDNSGSNNIVANNFGTLEEDLVPKRSKNYELRRRIRRRCS